MTRWVDRVVLRPDLPPGREVEITTATGVVVRLEADAQPGAAVRSAVLADVLRRLGEVAKLPRMRVADEPPDDVDLAALNVRPAAAVTTEATLLLAVAGAGDAGATRDPLQRRAALLARRRDEVPAPGDVVPDLGAWRADVAQWATASSAAPPVEPVRAVLAAVADDLDTPRALELMAELGRDVSLSPGARFEAFVLLDRVFAFDLARRVGY